MLRHITKGLYILSQQACASMSAAGFFHNSKDMMCILMDNMMNNDIHHQTMEIYSGILVNFI